MKIDVKVVLPPHGSYGFRLIYHLTLNMDKTLCGRKIKKDWEELSDRDIEADSRRGECGNCWGARRKVVR